jgi:outer membrane protein TolC
VVQAQRDLALSRSTEVTAQSNYVKARVDLHRATGDILEDNNVVLDEAYRGQISRPHDPIPPPQAQP